MENTYRPVFVGHIVLLDQLPKLLFLSVWLTAILGFAFGLVGVFVGLQHWAQSFAPAALISSLGIFGWAYFVAKRKYQTTVYRISHDGIEIDQEFPTTDHKSIRLRDIVEVDLQQSVFQRARGIATVYLETKVFGSSARLPYLGISLLDDRLATGVFIRDIDDGQRLYDRLKTLKGQVGK